MNLINAFLTMVAIILVSWKLDGFIP